MSGRTLVARFFGFIFRKLGQPPVMGEVLGGIVLGPSVLGYFFPQMTTFLFQSDALVFLKHVAELGISIYVELIVLNIGLSLGVITAKLFAMLVLMALVTTFMTGPLLRWIGIEKNNYPHKRI